jgi:hypothetical protein
MPHQIKGQMLDRAQAAAVLGVTPDFLMNCARRGKGPVFYRFSNQLTLNPRDELEHWMADCRVAPTKRHT